jgi:hypothetical protein
MIFRSSKQIRNNSIEETFDTKWFEENPYGLPENPSNTKQTVVTMDDVILWETLFEANPYRVYAAWNPFESVYLIADGNKYKLITGANAKEELKELLVELGLPETIDRADWVTPNQFVKNI